MPDEARLPSLDRLIDDVDAAMHERQGKRHRWRLLPTGGLAAVAVAAVATTALAVTQLVPNDRVRVPGDPGEGNVEALVIEEATDGPRWRLAARPCPNGFVALQLIFGAGSGGNACAGGTPRTTFQPITGWTPGISVAAGLTPATVTQVRLELDRQSGGRRRGPELEPLPPTTVPTRPLPVGSTRKASLPPGLRFYAVSRLFQVMYRRIVGTDSSGRVRLVCTRTPPCTVR
jgi:hypothetical protein